MMKLLMGTVSAPATRPMVPVLDIFWARAPARYSPSCCLLMTAKTLGMFTSVVGVRSVTMNLVSGYSV